MKYQRKATKVQVLMAVLIGVCFLSLVGFAIPEIAGIISPELEDTFSEFIWDLPLAVVIPITVVFLIVGVIASWAGVHFIEGWVERRKHERR